MRQTDFTFQTNHERGCSELVYGEFRAVASVFPELQAVDFEIELQHQGVWTTLYFERTVLGASLSCAADRRVVRKTLAEIALKKIQGYRQRLAQGEQLHPLAGDETDSPPGWLSQIDSEPL